MQDENIEVENLVGTYVDTIARDIQNSYTLIRVNTGTEVVVCGGHIDCLPPVGTTLKLRGQYKENNKYKSKRFEFSDLIEDYSNEEELAQYLSSAAGIGPITGRDIAKIFGEGIFEIVDRPDAVDYLSRAVTSVNEARARAVVNYIRNNKVRRQLYHLIMRCGGKYTAVSKIYDEHHELSILRLTDNPYLGLRYGLTFETCDKIAAATTPEGKKPNPYSYNRITGALVQILKMKTSSGDSYTPYTDLIKRTRYALGATEMDEAVATACINAALICNRNEIHRDDNAVYLSAVYHQECSVAYSVKRLRKYAIPITDFSAEEIIAYAEERCKAKYADQQKEAFNLLLSGGLNILTGGPGTGKSTVVRGLLAAYSHMRPDGVIKLCAPTGRASQRLKEVTNHEATTIHKLLEYKPFGEKIMCKNETDPIEADLLIVDESSMINLEIADLLFAAIKSGTTVILVGDTNQLPAVGAGDVLHDLIDSGIVPVVQLTKTYRQAGGSLIIKNATKIMQSDPQLLTGPDFEWISVENDDQLPAIVLEQFKKYNRSDDIFASQVICPARKKRATGSFRLSLSLQPSANIRFNGSTLRYGKTVFHVGDKVMFTRNNYKDGYFNGDVGVVTFIGSDMMEVDVDEITVKISEKNLEDVILAYACTVHKLQGSECETAIVVMPQEPANMLQRNLLYTAITRAKKKVVLLSSGNAVETAIKPGHLQTVAPRETKLKERLQNIK